MSGSGPYTEGWKLENPDALGARPVETVDLPHLVVTDELVTKALEAYEDERGPVYSEDRMRAALSKVAGELWQAGYDAATKPPRRPLPPGQVWAWIHDRVWDGTGEEPPGHYEVRGTGALLD